MAITLVEGFKYLPGPQSRYVAVDATSGTSTWSRQASRGGGYALRYTNSTTTDASANTGALRVGIGTSFNVAFAANHRTVASAAFASNVVGINLHVLDGNIYYYWSLPTGFVPTPAVIERASLPVMTATPIPVGWHWWNVVGIANVDSGGYLRLYRDGVLQVDMGPDVREDYGLSPGGPLGSMTIRLGNAAGTSGIDIADLIVRNDMTLIPDSRVDVLAPTSAVTSDWDGSDSDKVDNHLLVDDSGPTVDATDYVSTSTVGATETYGMADLPHSPASIYAVGVHSIGGKTGGGARGTALMVNSTEGAPVDGGTSDTIATYWETNPSGSVPWTKAAVDAMTAGIRIKT